MPPVILKSNRASQAGVGNQLSNNFPRKLGPPSKQTLEDNVAAGSGDSAVTKGLASKLRDKFKNNIILYYTVFVFISFALFIFTRYKYYDEI